MICSKRCIQTFYTFKESSKTFYYWKSLYIGPNVYLWISNILVRIWLRFEIAQATCLNVTQNISKVIKNLHPSFNIVTSEVGRANPFQFSIAAKLFVSRYKKAWYMHIFLHLKLEQLLCSIYLLICLFVFLTLCRSVCLSTMYLSIYPKIVNKPNTYELF